MIDVSREQRERYAELNRSFTQSRIQTFGGGRGFCADVVGLLKAMIECLAHRRRLVVATDPRGRGFSLGFGWADYFEDIFPTSRSRLLVHLNRHRLPAHSRMPKIILDPLLASIRSIGGGLMAFDALELPEELVVPELGIDLAWWEASELCLSMIWRFREDVDAQVRHHRAVLDLPEEYLALHVRRGDKITETEYVPLERYVETIERFPYRHVLVASDDSGIVAKLRGLLGRGFIVIPAGSPNSRGYDQRSFDAQLPESRWRSTVQFLCEFEAIRRATQVIVSTSSNVGCLIQYARGGRGVTDLGYYSSRGES